MLVKTLKFVFILLCAVASFSPNAAHAGQAESTIRFVRDPDLAPNIDVPSAAGGKSVKLDELRGKVVLLNFWATWCGPCREEVPDLVQLQNKYKDRLQIIGLAVDDDVVEVDKFVKETGINYPVAIATDAARIQYGGVSALPSSFVVDAEGRVVQKHVGLRDPWLYETEIRSLLGLSIEAKVETFEDTGEIFLKHADRASELPGVDFSGLNPTQKSQALHKFNAESCTCGCKFTLAQCRIYDSACRTSHLATAKIVSATRKSSETTAPSEPPTPASIPATPPE